MLSHSSLNVVFNPPPPDCKPEPKKDKKDDPDKDGAEGFYFPPFILPVGKAEYISTVNLIFMFYFHMWMLLKI